MKSTSSKVSDLAYLSETMGGNKKLIDEIIDLFLKQAPMELEDLNKAVESDSYPRIRGTAKRMQSSASIMGMETVIPILKEIEDLAKNDGSIVKILERKDEAEKIWMQAIDEIKEEATQNK